MANFTSVLNQLEQERTRLASQFESLNNALSALSVKGSSRKISAAGRARIAAAQRARWVKVKAILRRQAYITTVETGPLRSEPSQ
jgi:hypothetical protein